MGEAAKEVAFEDNVPQEVEDVETIELELMRNEVRLLQHIRERFQQLEDFDEPVEHEIDFLNVGWIDSAWREIVPIAETRFENFEDFLLYYEFQIDYPLVFPPKRHKIRSKGTK